jgi:2-oxoglutarate dehydrogenase E2 component (dihydrolipoamide succinyltransferase)
MSTEIKVPVFPESVEEGSIMAWHRQVGETVRADEKIAEIETDKVVLEVIAAADGVLEEILKQEGDTVTGGEVIGRLGEGDGAAPATPDSRQTPEPAPAPAPEPQPEAPPPREATPAPQPEPATAPPPAQETAAATAAIGPAARKLIQEKGLDVSRIAGSGRHGQITKADVAQYLADREQPSAPPPSPPPAAPAAVAPPPREDAGRRDQREPMSRLRARIADRLVEAQRTAAILTTFNEVDMKPVMDLRNRYKKEFEQAHAVKLGFMSFFVTAAIAALRKYPSVNASIEGQDIVYHHYYDIGIAVSSPRGLVVPILRDAERMSFAEIEAGIRDLGERAAANRLTLEDLQGGTFTISNGGVFGSMLSTPILNPPQSAILGMHAIRERPVAVNGQVEIRPVMYLALSYDHRIIDGREAVSALVTMKDMLEDPARLLLQV